MTRQGQWRGRGPRLRPAAPRDGPAAVGALLRDLLLPHRAGQQGAADHLRMAATIMILYVSKLNKIIHFPDFDKKIPVKLFPLPLLYVGNHISGLSSTSKLSLPMFTVLRKFTIPLTLLLETIILGKQYPLNIIISVFAIVLGAFIAAGSDLAFNLEGYVFVLLNDIFTAANGVYTKQKMDPQELGKYGVLFYNACFMIVPTLILSVSTGDLRQALHTSEGQTRWWVSGNARGPAGESGGRLLGGRVDTSSAGMPALPALPQKLPATPPPGTLPAS
ncbi:UDP-N-acetylglucosamine/UDP-glucose/GDP-mannose transporter isoform X8 [Myotis lucifugus]|uniref:UDP-N-acetylglucosamine/UDP-glucose/GDP-mannose transporter isoform X8 n=1 Tax=Myotis lucifugus TaxID=59463 RepID=UPI000CCC7039|nr:UDP-N-acetylglucosamine/UDP-glucose/GDP-mannose transporter isoform X8 [Myotis lucifugus]